MHETEKYPDYKTDIPEAEEKQRIFILYTVHVLHKIMEIVCFAVNNRQYSVVKVQLCFKHYCLLLCNNCYVASYWLR